MKPGAGTGFAEFRAGWRVLLSASVAVAFGSNVLPFNTLGALVGPLEAEFGWGRGDIQICYFLFTLLSGLSYPFIGALVDRYTARRVALIGVPAFSLAFAAIGLSRDSIGTFYALWMLAGLLGSAATPVTFTRLVNDWFVVRRGLALSITLVVAGLGSALQQVASTLLVEALGWRAALGCLALMPALIAWPLVLLYFRAPAPAAAPVDPASTRAPGPGGEAAPDAAVSGCSLREALSGYRFHALAFAIVCVTLGISGTMINFKPLMADAAIPSHVAAYVAGAVGISVVIGRLGTGLLIDRLWAPGLAFPLLALPALSCLLLAQSSLTPVTALVAGALIGLATGAEGDLMPYLTVRYFGLRHYGRIYGVLFAIFIIASGIAPYLFGLAFDRFGSYEPALLLASALFLTGAVLLLTLRAYPAWPDDAGRSRAPMQGA